MIVVMQKWSVCYSLDVDRAEACQGFRESFLAPSVTDRMGCQASLALTLLLAGLRRKV